MWLHIKWRCSRFLWEMIFQVTLFSCRRCNFLKMQKSPESRYSLGIKLKPSLAEVPLQQAINLAFKKISLVTFHLKKKLVWSRSDFSADESASMKDGRAAILAYATDALAWRTQHVAEILQLLAPPLSLLQRTALGEQTSIKMRDGFTLNSCTMVCDWFLSQPQPKGYIWILHWPGLMSISLFSFRWLFTLLTGPHTCPVNVCLLRAALYEQGRGWVQDHDWETHRNS